jgi:hypothetical protein
MDLTKAFTGSNDKSSGGIDGFDDAVPAPEFGPLPAGTYAARVLRGEYCATMAGEAAYRMRFEVTEGQEVGRSVIRTWTFGPKAIGYAKRDLQPFGLTTKEKLLRPFPDPGREYHVRLVVALRQDKDGIERNDIKRIDLVRVDESPANKFILPEPGEGGRID